jgi:hypothetical protein
VDNIKNARAYYAKALELQIDNVRALYGIALCSHALSNIKGGPKDDAGRRLILFILILYTPLISLPYPS